MKNLKRLYQQVLLDHNKNPRNFKKIQDPSHYAHGVNPLCGDDYHLFVQVQDHCIKDIGFYGSGCAISKSSASMMSDMVMNNLLTRYQLKDAFIQMLQTVWTQMM